MQCNAMQRCSAVQCNTIKYFFDTPLVGLFNDNTFKAVKGFLVSQRPTAKSSEMRHSVEHSQYDLTSYL